MYSTTTVDMNTWRRRMTPFRSEKDTKLEVPSGSRSCSWPDAFLRRRAHDIVQHTTAATLCAIAGELTFRRSSSTGTRRGGTTFKSNRRLHLLRSDVKGEKSPRQGSSLRRDGNLVPGAAGNWKAVFMEQRATGTLQICEEPFTILRIPKLYNSEQTRSSGRHHVTRTGLGT